MPIKICTSKGKKGKRWGDSGKCYTGPEAHKKAAAQAAAAYASGYKKENTEIEEEVDQYLKGLEEDEFSDEKEFLKNIRYDETGYDHKVPWETEEEE